MIRYLSPKPPQHIFVLPDPDVPRTFLVDCSLLDFDSQLLYTCFVQLPSTYFELSFVYLGARSTLIILNFDSGRVVSRFLGGRFHPKSRRLGCA